MLRIVPPGQRHSQPAAAVHRLRQPDDGFLLELQKAPGKRVHPGIAHRRKNIVVRGCQEQCGHVGIEIGDTFQGVDGVIALDILCPELPNKRFLPRKRRAASLVAAQQRYKILAGPVHPILNGVIGVLLHAADRLSRYQKADQQHGDQYRQVGQQKIPDQPIFPLHVRFPRPFHSADIISAFSFIRKKTPQSGSAAQTLPPRETRFPYRFLA